MAFTDPQYAELARLTEEIRSRYPIEDIVGHSDIAPGKCADEKTIVVNDGHRAERRGGMD